MTRTNNLLLSAALWMSIFIIDTLTACSAVQDAVPADRTPPEILGASDIVVYQGTRPDCMANVTARDDTDEAPVLTVDDSGISADIPGNYTAVYTAADSTGNRTSASVTVTVLEKKTGYADFPEIYAAVDAKLQEIITDSMNPRQQVEAIYSWARENLGYTGHSDKSDPYQAGYQMLTIGAGDCYNYFAVCKLMFDRLGIPNLDVVKVKNNIEDSQHFWSLVSVDGGESYYHFDATPRVGSGDDFCLVTDDFLDDYSRTHNLSHNRNRNLYPNTPEA